MASRRAWTPGERHLRTSITLLAGVAVGVLLVASLGAPTVGPSIAHAVPKGPATQHLPSLLPHATIGTTLANYVDPQFVPTVLTSPGAISYGRFGYSVAASGHFVVAGAPWEVGPYYGSNYSGRVYLTNTATGASSWVQAPDWWDDQLFGYSVALAGGTLVVGAPAADAGAGAAFVYQNEGGLWILVASLTSPDAQPLKENTSSLVTLQAAGNFGVSVAVSGSTVVVGAPNENSTGVYGAGHVYIFNLLTDLVKEISSPAPQVNGSFGLSVAVSGNRIVVGAPVQFGAGAAFLYAASTGDLIQSFSSLYPTYPYDGFEGLGGLFGYSVAINGTFVAVGAPFETVGSVHGGGHAYVFNLLNGSELALNASPPTTSFFGFSVAINPGTVLVGSPSANASYEPAYCGAAFLFSTVSGAEITSEFVSPQSTTYGDDGYTVAETASQFVVGAFQENGGGFTEAGHVYVYNQVPLTFASPHPTDGGLLGFSVAVNQTVVIGAPTEFADFTTGAGHAYILASHTGPFVTLTSPAAQIDGLFGYSVAVAGNRIAVGAPGESIDNGSAYLFTAGGAYVATLSDPSPPDEAFFGFSIAMAGNVVVVGAPGENLSAAGYESGAAYVFSASTGALLWTLQSPHGQPDGVFGYSVAVSGGRIVVGAPGEGDGTGAAYVFSASSGAELFALSDPGSGSNEFGFSVAIGGSTIAVGAPGQEFGANASAGEAFVFSSSTGALKVTIVTPNPVTYGDFGASVADNGGTVVVGAPEETAFGVSEAGNIYLVNPSNGAVLDRYNSPDPAVGDDFGASIAIGPAGVIAVGEPYGGAAGSADLFFL